MLTMQKRLTSTFHVILSLPATAMGFALSIQISALSWLLSTHYNLDIHEVGIVWAAGPLAGIFGQVIVGLISDKAWFWGGRRRPFILIGGSLTALMLFLLPRLGEVNETLGAGNILIIAVLVALTMDLSINISFNPTRALIADVTPEGSSRTKGYTWMQTISGFWGVMAYVLSACFGNYFLINIGVIIVLLFSVFPTIFIAEVRVITPENEVADSPQIHTEWQALWRIYFAHGFSWIGVQTMFVYILAFVQQYLISPSASPAEVSSRTSQIIAISFAVLNTVGFLLPAFVLEPIAEKFGRVRTQMCCIGIMAGGYFLIVLAGTSPMRMYIFMAIVGIGWAAIVSLPFAIMTEKIDRNRIGFFMGIFNLSVVIPQLFVSLALGIIIQQTQNKNIIFMISGVSLTLSAILWYFVQEKKSE